MNFNYQLNLLLVFLFLCASVEMFGQESKKMRKWAVQFNLQHQDISALDEISIGQLGVVHDIFIRPFYSLDIQRFFYKNEGKNRFFLLSQLGYFANLYQDRWRTYELGLGYERYFTSRLFSSIRVKLGKADVKDHDLRYVHEGGKWVESPNNSPSNPSSLTSVRLDLGYRVLDAKFPVDIVGNGQFMIRGHHDFGAIPYIAVGLGARLGL